MIASETRAYCQSRYGTNGVPTNGYDWLGLSGKKTPRNRRVEEKNISKREGIPLNKVCIKPKQGGTTCSLCRTSHLANHSGLSTLKRISNMKTACEMSLFNTLSLNRLNRANRMIMVQKADSKGYRLTPVM